MFHLAQSATPPPAVLIQWFQAMMYFIGCAGGVLGCLVAIKSLRRPHAAPVTVSPQPLEVKPHAAFATVAQLEDIEKQAHGRMNRERAEMKERIDSVEGKLDRNTELTAAMRGEVKLINQQLAQVLQKLLSQ